MNKPLDLKAIEALNEERPNDLAWCEWYYQRAEKLDSLITALRETREALRPLAKLNAGTLSDEQGVGVRIGALKAGDVRYASTVLAKVRDE